MMEEKHGRKCNKFFRNWDINLHWSDDEKEALGIKKKDNIMSVDEFNSFVSELINDIKDYQEAISCLK